MPKVSKVKRPAPLCSFSATQICSDWCLSLVFVGFNLLILCWFAGANDEVHSFKFNPYFLTLETFASLLVRVTLAIIYIYITFTFTLFLHVFFTKRNLAQYPHRSALQAPYFACAEIWWIAMFLAYQRASRPYKRLVFDDFTFFNFYIFFKITIWIPSPPRSYRHLAGVRYSGPIF